VPVRVHLLRSTIESLDASLDEAAFRAVLEQASAEWVQACIRFSVERIVEDPLTAQQEQTFRSRVSSGFQDSRTLMRDAMPVGNLLEKGWNVMVFRNFTAPASGVYLGEIQSLLWSEKLPPMAPPGDNPPLILAHEFGHSFGLRHYEGAEPHLNLMNAEVMQTRQTARGLTADQVQDARAQVATGDTAATSP
jgi:hypothetical protein